MFSRHFVQTMLFHTDTRRLLPPSQREYPILGIKLLHLMVHNRTSALHAELELLSRGACPIVAPIK